MGNIENKDTDLPEAYYSLYNNNYLINSYKCLIRSKLIHFLVTLIEIIYNIFEELRLFLKDYNPENKNEEKFINILLYFPKTLENLSTAIKILIVLLYIIVFDAIYFFLGKIKIKKKNKFIEFLYNLIDLFYFRISLLIFLNIYFSQSPICIFILLVFLIFHLYITIFHFLYNRLYVFVPVFVEYPYDKFSSLFDCCLLIIKLLLSIIESTKNISLKNFIYISIILLQILFSLYFIYLLRNKSYLFIKNLLINKSKIALFLIQSIIIIIIELIGKDDIHNINFIIILVCLSIVIFSIIYLFYEPMIYMKIQRETPDENMIFFLNILSLETQPIYIIENQIEKHFEICGICNLCERYIKYIRR